MPLDTFKDVCVGSSVGTGKLCLSFPGGAELCANIPSVLPTTDMEQVLDLLAQLNTAMSPLQPVFNVLEAVLEIGNIFKAVLQLLPVPIPVPNPHDNPGEYLLGAFPGLAEKIEALAKLAPPLSMPVLLIDAIDALIRYLNATKNQLVKMAQYKQRILDASTRAAATGIDVQFAIDCANENLDATIVFLGEQAEPINRLIGILNGFLKGLGLPCIPSLSAPSLDGTFLDLLDALIAFLEYLRGLIKLPFPFLTIGVSEDDC